MTTELVETIKTRGYWRINFRPRVYEPERIRLPKCWDVVRRNSLNLKGWAYPHVPNQRASDAGFEPGDRYYQAWIDWGPHVELWRMYQSGQFIHYLALIEDRIKEYEGNSSLAVEPMTTLFVGATVELITEFYEFLVRLTREGLYDEGARVIISLHNTKDRELALEKSGRMGLTESYKCSIDSIPPCDKEISKNDALTNSKELALETIQHVFDRFGWHNLPIGTIKKDQEDLLAGKI